MIDRENVIKEFEHLLNAAKGNYQDFVDLTVDGGDEILALLKEHEAATIKKTKEIFGVYGGICPRCNNWIQSPHSYCGFCGQAVKWSD